MSALLPRLPSIAAKRLLDDLLDTDLAEWPTFRSRQLPPATQFAPTGGARATAPQLEVLHQGILETARRCGMGTGRSRDQHAQFDRDMAAWLAEYSLISDSEALRDEFWSFVGVVIAPRIVWWRFGRSRERYLGGVRNTFQRLWFRARVLDRGSASEDRWGLLAALPEDALVQIMERPSIGADPRLARALAEAWVRAAEEFGKSGMEDVTRRATLLARVQNEIRSLASLDRGQLASVLDDLFDSAMVGSDQGGK